MHKGHARMHLNGEPPVGGRDKGIGSCAGNLSKEPYLTARIPHMLEYRIGPDQVKLFVGEWERAPIVRDSGNGRVATRKLFDWLDSERRDIGKIRIVFF